MEPDVLLIGYIDCISKCRYLAGLRLPLPLLCLPLLCLPLLPLSLSLPLLPPPLPIMLHGFLPLPLLWLSGPRPQFSLSSLSSFLPPPCLWPLCLAHTRYRRPASSIHLPRSFLLLARGLPPAPGLASSRWRSTRVIVEAKINAKVPDSLLQGAIQGQ